MKHEFFDRFFGHSHFSPRGWDRGGRGPGRGGRGMGRGGPHHHHDERGHPGHDERDVAQHMIKRLLGHGDLRYVVLLLIEEQPRHGYELIKLIETKSSGQYAPSPGVIYPTLTFLEETGMVTTTTHNDKKQYTITKEGIAHLDENRAMTVGILQRLEEVGAKIAALKAAAADRFEEGDVGDIRMVFHDIRRELMASMPIAAKTRKRIVEVMQGALVEIQKILKEGKS